MEMNSMPGFAFLTICFPADHDHYQTMPHEPTSF